MPNDPNAKRLREQARNEARLLKQLEREREWREYNLAVEKLKKQAKRNEEKRLHDILRRIKGTGIYEPKSEELTRYRKKRLREVAKEYSVELRQNEYKFIPASKSVRDKAEQSGIRTTKRGLFAAKQGFKDVSLKEDKRRNEFYLHRGRKIKTGERAGRRYTSITPLVSADELEKERDRLRRAAKRLGPMEKGDRYTFVVRENGYEGFSHSTFSRLEDLFEQLDRYQKSLAGRVQFVRHVTIEKSTTAEWFSLHPPKGQNPARRRIHTKARHSYKKGGK